VADERPAASDGCVGGDLLAEARLANTRLAGNHCQRALARDCSIEGALQLPQLLLAADKGAAIEGIRGCFLSLLFRQRDQ